MDRKMGIEGVGPRIAAPTAIFIIIAYLITKAFPGIFKYVNDRNSIALAFWLFLAIGIILWGGSAVQMVVSWRKGRLITTGFYAVFLNPLYGAFILFLIPALSLYLNSWLCLIGSLVLLLAMKKHIKEEEDYLREVFGKEYEDYRKKVLIKL